MNKKIFALLHFFTSSFAFFLFGAFSMSYGLEAFIGALCGILTGSITLIITGILHLTKSEEVK